MATKTSKLYHCGTLTYTRAGLFALFAWMLWGDFCYTLMESVGGVVPLNLKALGASNFTMQLILGTIPAILNATVCPWVSFKSDRYRSKWGRRIPFILSTMPFLVASLILTGWSRELTPICQRLIPQLAHVAPATVTVGLIAVFMTMFTFFNMFINSVFWYLFNDVVPPQFLGRFTGLFRMVGTGAGSFYSYFIFKHSETHMREIMTGGALLYLIGFGLMCLRVKEGSYPPPADEPVNSDHKFLTRLDGVRRYFKECFTVKFYWLIFLTTTLGVMGGAMGMYGVFFSKQMGLTLEQMGKMGGISGIAAFAATYFTAIFVDRWHPLRIMTYYAIFGGFFAFGPWIWLCITLPNDVYYWTSLAGMLVGTFTGTLIGACWLPVRMRLLPKSVYGQFCSADAMVRSVGQIFSSLIAGGVMDLIMHLCHGSDFAYRWMFVWSAPFTIGVAVCYYLCYRTWRRLGGDDNYRPPAPWLPGGFEEVTDKVVTVKAPPRRVMLALWINIGNGVIGWLLTPFWLILMYRHHLMNAFNWSLWTLPLSLLLFAANIVQVWHIWRDVKAQERGERTRFGIPHYGILLVNAIQGVVGLPIGWYQSYQLIHRGLEWEIVIFGLYGLINGVLGLSSTQFIRWMERPVKDVQYSEPAKAVLDAEPVEATA